MTEDEQALAAARAAEREAEEARNLRQEVRRFSRTAGRTFKALVVFVVIVVFVGIFALSAVNRQAAKTIASIRDGCEDANVLRVNQALALQEQIAQTRRSLRGSLGVLEPFRKEVEDGLEQREFRLSAVAASVRDHPLRGRKARQYPKAERPYRTDCIAAYP